MSAPYPQLLDLASVGGRAPAIDTPPTYTDIFNQYFADDVTPDADLDSLIAQAGTLTDALDAELPLLAADISPLLDAVGNPINPFDTSGSDALEAAWPGVINDSLRVCAAFTAALNAAGVAGTGSCDAAATGPPPGSPGGGPGTTPGAPAGNPYPPSSNPAPNGSPGCPEAVYPPTISMALPDLQLGDVPYVLQLTPSVVGTGYSAFYGDNQLNSGPFDMMFLIQEHQVPGTSPFWTSWALVIYPARVGIFNSAISFYTDPNGSPSAVLCLSFNVVQPAGAIGPAPVTPQTSDELLATVSGQYTGRAVVDLGTYHLGANPKPTWSDNTQWGYPTSGVYTDGELVGGPADMLVTWGDVDDPVSPGAFTQLGFIVLPVRVGSWAWLIKYYEDAAHNIPVYLCFTATVTAPAGG